MYVKIVTLENVYIIPVQISKTKRKFLKCHQLGMNSITLVTHRIVMVYLNPVVWSLGKKVFHWKQNIINKWPKAWKFKQIILGINLSAISRFLEIVLQKLSDW